MDVVGTRGIGHAKRLVADYLRSELPAYLAELRLAWAIEDAADLPNPVEVTHNEPQALDRYPLLAVVGVRTAPRRRVGHDVGGAIVYEATYGLRVFVWARDQGWDRTIDVRDNLTAAVSTLLLDRQTLGRDDAVIDETTVLEEYSDVTPVRGDRYVAGSFVAFDLQLAETLRRTQDGTVASANVETTELPHPALA